MKRNREKGRARTKSDVPPADCMYLLRLYVAGAKSQSVKAVANTKHLCNKYLQGRHKLEIVDIYRYPRRARDEQIVAAPTLIKRLPLPLRKFIGDMSNPERILVSLNIKREDS